MEIRKQVATRAPGVMRMLDGNSVYIQMFFGLHDQVDYSMHYFVHCFRHFVLNLPSVPGRNFC
jgi:hypothetical protein